jgi:hypothetical protein
MDLPSFFILTYEGESLLPSSFDLNKHEIVLYLDANVCLDIVNYFDNKVLSDKALINVQTLIVFCQQNKIEVVPKFGVIELCHDKYSKNFDILKYREFVNKITYAFDKTFDNSTKLNQTDFKYEVGEMDRKMFDTFLPLILTSYVTLLKIYVLCKKNNPKKENVHKNLKLLLHWCDKHLNASMASEILLAIKIFGGSSEYKKMIALDKVGENVNDILKSIWGTSWDFFHIRMIHYASMNVDTNHKQYFVTQDRNIYTLLKSNKRQGAITLFQQPFIYFLSHDLEIQYKEEYILDEVHNILREFIFKRSANSRIHEQIDLNSIDSLKIELESDIRRLYGKQSMNQNEGI